MNKRLNQLENAGIIAICVFDGQKLPAKKLTNQKRRESRANAIKMAKECLANGDPKAYNYFCQGLEIELILLTVRYYQYTVSIGHFSSRSKGITISPEINKGVRDLCLKRGLRRVSKYDLLIPI